MFLVHNITSGRVAFKLFPVDGPAEGTPNWRAKRDLRHGTVHVVIDPHMQKDLTTFGFTEDQILRQPEVLDFLRKGYLRKVVDSQYVDNAHRPSVAPDAPALVVEAVSETVEVAPVILEMPKSVPAPALAVADQGKRPWVKRK